MTARALLVLTIIAAAACDDDTVAPATDLAAPVEDLAVPPDLLPPPEDMTMCTYPPDAFGPAPDAAGFCDGTPLAGTCAQPFFAKLAACFHPAGCCQEAGSNQVEETWQSGAQRSFDMTNDVWAFFQDGQLCARNTNILVHPTEEWQAGDGSDLPDFDPTSGIGTCPDGTRINVGPWGGCPALQSLLAKFIPCDYSPSCCTPYPPP